jgi:hypothetical protein
MGILLMLKYYESIISIYFSDFMKKYWLHPKYCWYNFCYLKVFNKHLNNVYLATLVFKTLYRPKHAEIGSICANQGGLQQNLVEEGRRFVTKTPMCGNLKCKVIDLGWFILLSHNWSMYSIIIKLSGLQIANYDGVGIIVQLTILFMLIDIRNSGTRLSHWYWKLYRTTIVLHADRTPSHVQPDMLRLWIDPYGRDKAGVGLRPSGE